MSSYERGDYFPDEKEEYMSERQLNYFKQQLNNWRSELEIARDSFTKALKETPMRKPDPVDQSASNSDMARDLETRNRQQHLIRQIDFALGLIEEGEYGYCEISGEEIGLKRLMARPIATRCIEVQERLERMSAGPGKHAVACMV
ncbi:TraR/DksA family transcriptional regulator [Desulfosediminicola flagellatus]|uniref:TraR/DksA family transcriptional regulator n=1 Tax=Desulfosediminicola flagellatus TaxID=2569541 RepID=UPI0010ACDA9F|nr:TraR/DksA C4-type zinc finger protein [Desulfosediminicola flagellatus]